MSSDIVRQVLSESLFELYKAGEQRILCQMPFVDKEGNTLYDEEVDYIDIVKATKEILQAGASGLYYIRDRESFLLTNILNLITYFKEENIKEIKELLIENITEKELKNLLPTHANKLIKEMLQYEEELVILIRKGLEFKQDIDNYHGEDAIEVSSIKRGNIDFFINLAKNSIELDFDIIYNKGYYNETTLKNEINKLKEQIKAFEDNKVDILIDDRYEAEKYQRKKQTINLLEKWQLKSKIDKIDKVDRIKETKFKI